MKPISISKNLPVSSQTVWNAWTTEEGIRILAVDPPTLLSFTWNAPPDIPAIRKQRTWVESASGQPRAAAVSHL